MKLYQLLLIIVILLTACQPAAQPPTPTSTSLPTSTSSPPPTSTNTPEPTSTPEPSPTPIVLPDTLHQTFSGVSVIHRDSFEFVIQNAVPAGWQTDQQYAIWVTEENQLKAHPLPSSFGTVFYYSDKIIDSNMGVYLAFKFMGTTENFTLGFDNVNSNGERIQGADFRSVAMEVRNQNPIVYGNFGGATAKGSFKGTLTLQEDTWYNVTLAFDENQNYIVKIWQPDNPEKQLTYQRTWEDFPDKYYFISWINSKRSLLIDDFTVFTFEEIIQQ
jgi:hypothetical protein